jgi:hypothetical protein
MSATQAISATQAVLVTLAGPATKTARATRIEQVDQAEQAEQLGQGRDTDMGERQSGSGMPGRRRVHPGGVASGHGPGPAAGPRAVLDDDALEALLAAAMLRHQVDAEGEQRAVAAFLAARDAGLHQSRSRRRDDWRPREQRRLARSVKAALSLFAASLALGGVAVAAIGSGDSSDDPGDGRGGSPSASSAPDRPSADPSSAASDARSAQPGHPGTAQDTEARCRAYEQVKDRGNALDSTAWQRLVTAAGGEEKVAAYCAEQLAKATETAAAKNRPSQAATPGGKAGSATNGADDAATGAGNAGNGTEKAGNGGDNADNGGDNADNADSGAGNADSGTGSGRKN